MLLREMFSAIGAPKDEEGDINWMDDLKFFIDNESDMLSKYMFPAIKKHKEYGNHPTSYKLYIKPIERCKETYIDKYKIESPEEKFPRGDIIGLAKKIAEEQFKHIQDGDYEN